MGSDRYTVISCDCHVEGRPEDYAQYIDPDYREQYAEYNRLEQVRLEEQMKAIEENRSLFSKEGMEAYEQQDSVMRGGRDGLWDSKCRARVLEEDGVVAEVLFPNSGVPFGAFGEAAPPDQRIVGNHAYNRWLADFCADLPGRRAGMALLPVHDITLAVEEIHWAKEHGLKGIVPPSSPDLGLPPYYDQVYEPIWAACEELGMPLHMHSGGGGPDYGDYGAVSNIMYAVETPYYSQRTFWFLALSGVFERHPELTFVITEGCADWVPRTLRYLDMVYEKPFFSHIWGIAKHRPSEYWARQCYVAASFMTRDEALMRHDIGLDGLMWGSDFPHPEGVWPNSRQSLADIFVGVPPDEVRTILSVNPARVYGFDLEALDPISQRVGPPSGVLAQAS